MFYAALCDMTLYMYSDENSYKRSTHCSNVIHLHHSLATKAGDYIKKNHVFRLQTADMAQYLIQTRFTSELCTCLLSLYTVEICHEGGLSFHRHSLPWGMEYQPTNQWAPNF